MACKGIAMQAGLALGQAAAWLALAASARAAGQLPTQPPNVVLVMADDQGWGDMAYNGHPDLKTPHFDEAAAAGLRFDRFYAAAPVCSPTRARVLTGRHPNRMGVFQWGHVIRPQETTVAETLAEAGYACGHFGKWHLGSVRRTSPANPGANGFDHWLSAPNFYDNDATLSLKGRATPCAGESSAIAVDAAVDWIASQVQRERNFLAVVWFGSPHQPHQAAARDQELYANAPSERQDFYGEITGMDRAFGRLRAALQTLGVRDNTLLWYCSDNGGLPKLGSTGGRGAKGQVYEGGLRVPAMVEWPAQIDRPRSTKYQAATCDILPTVIDAVGIAAAPTVPLDGISLMEVIGGADGDRPRPIGFWHRSARGRPVRSAELMGELLAAQRAGADLEPDLASRRAAKLPDPKYPLDAFPGHAAWLAGRWKLHRLEADNRTPRWELYDLKRDAAEANNVAASHPAVASALSAELEAWLKSVVNSCNGADY